MIRLHPFPDADHNCPDCHVALTVRGWYIPGMRNMADLHCPHCQREFWGDLASGQAVYTPLLLDKNSGCVHDPYNGPASPTEVRWFAAWLRESYSNRTSAQPELTIKAHRPHSGRAVLLNCLDRLYGHCLLKLLNAQYYLDHHPDLDLIVLIPRCLEWMVPDGVAQTWVVDLPLNRGAEWNDHLASALQQSIAKLKACFLSVAFSHPDPADYQIVRFTNVRPFPIDEWEARLARPTVTFIWREDRLWDVQEDTGRERFTRLSRKVTNFLYRPRTPLERQSQAVVALATALRTRSRGVDFAVAGLGKTEGLPAWISDMRVAKVTEETEKLWCKRYASSHIVVGVHGSNMLLPSAHAGAVIELVPADRWGNLPQATLFRATDQRVSAYRYRYVPVNTSVADLAAALSHLLTAHKVMIVTMPKSASDHSAVANARSLRHLLFPKVKS